MRQSPTLVIMVKAPLMGGVKTRLAREIGAGEALRFYRAASQRLIRTMVRDPRWRTMLAVAPDAAVDAPFWPAHVARVAQGPGDLGQRMQRLLDAPCKGPVAIIGSDIPGITPCHVAGAFAALGPADAVFGPAPDGGYWLVGARRTPKVPDLFAGVRWSSAHTLADSLNNAAHLETALLDELEDVDDAASHARWRQGGEI